MRVLLVPLAASPHFFVQVPLVWALRAAGHEVRVASQPDLMDTVTAAGLPATPVGPRLDSPVPAAHVFLGYPPNSGE